MMIVRFTILIAIAVLMGCASRNPQTILNTGVKKEFNIQSHRDQIYECILNEMDAYPIYFIEGNEQAATIRRYKEKTELVLYPSLVILRDNSSGGADVEIIVKQPYWKTQNLLEKYESFIKNCGRNLDRR